MYIAMLKTTDNQIAIQCDTLSKAINTLNNLMEGKKNIKEALVLEETKYLNDQLPDFDSCRLVASLSIIK